MVPTRASPPNATGLEAGPLPGLVARDSDRLEQVDAVMPLSVPPDASNAVDEDSPLWPALQRGWQRRCPNCGVGPMMNGYLKVRDHCPVCNEDLHHHRADDGPAYLTLLIVGHLMAPLLIWAFTAWRPEPVTLATVFTIGTVGLSLYLLPRLKGAMVGFQWAKRMHGFTRRIARPA